MNKLGANNEQIDANHNWSNQTCALCTSNSLASSSQAATAIWKETEFIDLNARILLVKYKAFAMYRFRELMKAIDPKSNHHQTNIYSTKRSSKKIWNQYVLKYPTWISTKHTFHHFNSDVLF